MAGRLANRHNVAKEPLKIRIKKNDVVKVIARLRQGQDRTGARVDRMTGRLTVEGVMLAKKHVKPNPAKGVKGGIAESEATIHVSNVMVMTADGKVTRIGVKEETVGGKTRRVRVARTTGEVLDKK